MLGSYPILEAIDKRCPQQINWASRFHTGYYHSRIECQPIDILNKNHIGIDAN